ncbi:MAG: glycosyltransferase family 2 protein [Nitrososphaeraceae archaeon]
MATNHKLLSICIPTYNRADYLKRLLDNIIPQILEYKEWVEVCISNNGSTDNTREIVFSFKETHPDLFKYNENEENLGFDRNVLKVVNMAEGEFVWTFSDDDLIVNNGFKEVIRFIIENKDKDMGGMVIKFSSYTEDLETGKKIKYQSSVDENKPEMYGGLSCLEMLQEDNSYNGLSEIIFNNIFLNKILKENQDLVIKGIGTHHFHTWIFFLLFLLNREAKFYVLNKNIAISPDTMSKSEYMMDDHLELIYRGRIQFYDNLLSIIDKSEKDIIRVINKKLKRHPILSMIHIIGLYKAFGVANYNSCIQCIKLSFKYLSFVKALSILVSIIIISIIPSILVKQIWKISLRFRPRTKDKIESNWLETCIALGSWSQGAEEGRSAKETGMFLKIKP